MRAGDARLGDALCYASSVADQGTYETVERLCRDLFAPFVHADGGVIYLVSATPDDVHLHLAGACAGCPGSSFTRDRILEPVFAQQVPKAKLRVTTGYRIPEGAKKITPA